MFGVCAMDLGQSARRKRLQMEPINIEKAIDCLGDRAVFECMVVSFLEEVDQMMVVLADAVKTGDSEAIREKAHWVKGGLVYLHAQPSAEAAKNLELAADLGQEALSRAHEELKRQVSLLKSALNDISPS